MYIYVLKESAVLAPFLRVGSGSATLRRFYGLKGLSAFVKQHVFSIGPLYINKKDKYDTKNIPYIDS